MAGHERRRAGRQAISLYVGLWQPRHPLGKAVLQFLDLAGGVVLHALNLIVRQLSTQLYLEATLWGGGGA